MQALLLDEQTIRNLIEERRRCGGDRYDEVWDGVYVMSPLASNEHQRMVGEITRAIADCVSAGAMVLPGANVSDRREGWEHNYRCPDVVVVLAGTRATDAGTHWVGGPDFLVEVVSPNDKSRDKLGFYASLGVRELLLVERDGKAFQLYRLAGGALGLAGSSSPAAPAPVGSVVLPVTFSSLTDPPALVVTDTSSGRSWRI